MQAYRQLQPGSSGGGRSQPLLANACRQGRVAMQLLVAAASTTEHQAVDTAPPRTDMLRSGCQVARRRGLQPLQARQQHSPGSGGAASVAAGRGDEILEQKEQQGVVFQAA